MTDYIIAYEDNIDGYNHYKEEAIRLADKFNTDTTIKDGIVRWNSNNRIPPRDILEFWNYLNYDFNYEKTLVTKDKEDTKFIKRYKENQEPPTEEELFEMRANFGKGTTVEDVISGRKIKL